MEGDRMEQAKRALAITIKQLPSDSKFNIVSFGSRHNFCYPAYQDMNTDNLQKALKYIENMQADMGGTEILDPLQDIMRTEPSKLRHILVFTDVANFVNGSNLERVSGIILGLG